MKRILVLVSTNVLLALALALPHQGQVASQEQPATPFAGAYEHPGRFIPVVASMRLDGDAGDLLGWKDGDQCNHRVDADRYRYTDHQIVVRNHIDEIVALQDLEGTLRKTDSGSWSCEAYYEIDVPDAPFYTVYLGDERIVGYAAANFPIDEYESVWVNISADPDA